MMFVLSYTIIETSSKLLSVSIGVPRCTELRPLLSSTFALQKKKKIVTSRILPFVFNEMCGRFLISKRLHLHPSHIRNTF